MQTSSSVNLFIRAAFNRIRKPWSIKAPVASILSFQSQLGVACGLSSAALLGFATWKYGHHQNAKPVQCLPMTIFEDDDDDTKNLTKTNITYAIIIPPQNKNAHNASLFEKSPNFETEVEAITAAIDGAFQTWAKVTPLTFTNISHDSHDSHDDTQSAKSAKRVGKRHRPTIAPQSDADIELQWIPLGRNQGTNFFAEAGPIKVQKHRLQYLILLDSKKQWISGLDDEYYALFESDMFHSIDNIQGKYISLFNVAMHEIGHVLGLQHPKNIIRYCHPNGKVMDVMCPYYMTTAMKTLSEHDRQRIQLLYGTNDNHHSHNDDKYDLDLAATQTQ